MPRTAPERKLRGKKRGRRIQQLASKGGQAELEKELSKLKKAIKDREGKENQLRFKIYIARRMNMENQSSCNNRE